MAPTNQNLAGTTCLTIRSNLAISLWRRAVCTRGREEEEGGDRGGRDLLGQNLHRETSSARVPA